MGGCFKEGLEQKVRVTRQREGKSFVVAPMCSMLQSPRDQMEMLLLTWPCEVLQDLTSASLQR